MNATQERWLPVPGYEGLYDVSDQGRIRSLDRTVPRGQGSVRITGRVLRPGRGPNGYSKVGLWRAGVLRTVYVHQTVMEVFVGPRPFPKAQTRHRDGNKDNNALANLRYGTREENSQDMIRHGRSTRGAKNSQVKLTEDEVREIRALYAAGAGSHSSLGKRFDVDPETIRGIVIRRSWAWLD